MKLDITLPANVLLLCSLTTVHAQLQLPLSTSRLTTAEDHISHDVHAHWMRQAIDALYQISPCPFQAFGTAIVNHTGDNGIGKLICTGANLVIQTGNPSLHGEIAAIKNCTDILIDPSGAYRMSPDEVQTAWHDLTLYTTAEACSMCATAIRFAGFKGYVYATSLDSLVEFGWAQLSISSSEVFNRSSAMGRPTTLVADMLSNETDPLLSWQFRPKQSCPRGCRRSHECHGWVGTSSCCV